MASPPPPYANVTGISRAVMKDSPQETFANYDGNARAGELVVNLDVNPPTLYIGNSLGNLNQVTGGGGGNASLPLSNGNSQFNIATAGGDVTITSNSTQVWTFIVNGNLSLPGSGIIGNPANSSQDPLNPNVSTLIFRPDMNYGQQLVIDPTAPGHIHLRTNTYGNIDEPTANLFLGGEDSSFEVGYYTGGGAPEVYIHSGGNTWTFSTDGNLFAPGNVRTQANVIVGSEANGYVISPEDSLIMKAYANVQIITNNSSPKTWTFDSTGNLTLPGNIVGASANVQIAADGFIWTFNNLGLVSNPVITYSALPSANTAGYRAFISDANLVASGNFGNAVSGGGSNTVPVYSDGSNWRIG